LKQLAILRTTPALFGLFSIVVLWAHHLPSHLRHSDFQAAWYQKPLLTFSDVLASVRQRFWQVRLFHTSAETTDIVKVPKALL
jgi:hypothetical protein